MYYKTKKTSKLHSDTETMELMIEHFPGHMAMRKNEITQKNQNMKEMQERENTERIIIGVISFSCAKLR